jgi:hypothetical protein
MILKMSSFRRQKRLLQSILLGLLFLVNPALGQEAETRRVVFDFDDIPLLVSAGVQYGSYYGSEYNRRFPFKVTAELGLWFEYALFQKYPFYSGLEWQWRGYDINSEKKGKNQNGMDFIQTSKGRVDLHYLSIPLLFRYPLDNPTGKIRLLAGLNTAFRFLYKDSYCSDYQIPQTGFKFDSCYSKFRNDAMDYIDFHGVAGLIFNFHPRASLLLLGAYKLGGISISKENFLTRRELNNHFSLKLLWKVGRLKDLPFF